VKVPFFKLNNKTFSYFLSFALLFALIFIAKTYWQLKKNYGPIKIKISLEKIEKKSPRNWGKLLIPEPVKLPQKYIDTINTKLSSTKRPKDALSLSALANLLDEKMKNIDSLNLAELEKNIEISNELIEIDPDIFSAYKAKLISTLVKEAKFGISIDDSEIQTILEKMASFDFNSDNLSQRESELIAVAQNEIILLDDKIEKNSDEIEKIELLIDDIAPESPSHQSLMMKREELLNLEAEYLNRQKSLQDNIQNTEFPEESYLNEDLVEIPFLRELSKAQYNNVISSAEVFIYQYPNSLIGHYYLILALDLSGRSTEALQAFQDARLSNEQRVKLRQKLESAKLDNPKNYWKKLHF